MTTQAHERKRVLILWADSRSSNLGVQVLALGSARLIERTWSGAQVRSQSYGDGDAPEPLGLRSILKCLPPFPRSSPMRRWLSHFDLVVDTGAGDSFSDIYGLRRLLEMTLMGVACRLSGVKLILGSQTVGPFKTRRGRLLARVKMQMSEIVCARDLESSQVARQLTRTKIVTASDVVFELGKEISSSPTERTALLNVSGLLWYPNGHVDYKKYRKDVPQLISALQQHGFRVHLLAHVIDSPDPDNDVPACREVAESVDGGLEILIPNDLTDVRQMISQATLVVGSRMHACLNAVSQEIPAVALSYSPKFKRLFTTIGLWPPLELSDPNLVAAFSERLDNLDEDESSRARLRAVRMNDDLSREMGILL